MAEFTRDGVLKTTLTGNGQLNSPWGVAQAPASFGNLGGDLLVGNFGDGHINAFDANGNFVDVVRDAAGNPITIGNLWGLRFGNGAGSGDANTLFFTAGVTDAPALAVCITNSPVSPTTTDSLIGTPSRPFTDRPLDS